MPYLYLLNLSNNENVAIISFDKNNKISKGCSSKIFKNLQNSFITNFIVLEFNQNTYIDIIKKIRKSGNVGVHCLKNECFLTVDNIVWWIGLVDILELVEYKLIFE